MPYVCCNKLCQQSDASKFFYTPDAGSNVCCYVCTECGGVQPDLDPSTFAYLLDHDTTTGSECGSHDDPDSDLDDMCQLINSVVRSNRKRGCFKGTYSRRVHLDERFSAHNRREPEISDAHLEIIVSYHNILLEKDWFYREACERGIFGKREVQKLLRLVDAKLDPPLYNKYYKPIKFCRLYLERWNTLVGLLVEIELPIYTADQVAQIGFLFMKFSNTWDDWQPAAYASDRTTWKFKKRKHFPNINYTFQQLHRLLNLQHMNKFFPIPTTKYSIEQLDLYWKEMCDHLSMPFYSVKLRRWVTEEEKPKKQLTMDQFMVK